MRPRPAYKAMSVRAVSSSFPVAAEAPKVNIFCDQVVYKVGGASFQSRAHRIEPWHTRLPLWQPPGSALHLRARLPAPHRGGRARERWRSR